MIMHTSPIVNGNCHACELGARIAMDAAKAQQTMAWRGWMEGVLEWI